MNNTAPESSLVGSILIDGGLLARVMDLVGPEDFTKDAHRVVFEACRSLAERSEGIDLVTVGHELDRTGRLERAGGAAYLAGLVDVVPDVENVTTYARAVRSTALARRAAAAFRRGAEALESGTAPEGVLPTLEGALTSLRAGTVPASAGRLLTPDALLEQFLLRRSVVVPTPLRGLNHALGGGLETRRNAVIATQAGGGKTALAVQFIAHAVTSGPFYGVLGLKDGDQWADGLRLAQMAGVDRFRLRDHDPDSVEAARTALSRYAERLLFYDVTAPGATFADMAEQAKAWAGDRGPLVLAVDSLHTFPAEDRRRETAMPLYDRIAFRLEVLHDFLVRNDAAGITVGQSGRALYGRQRPEENADPLTAVSGGHVTENTVDVLLVLTKPNDEGTRFIVVPKSRLGGQGARVPVRFDPERSLWLDVEGEAPVEAGATSTARQEARARAETEARDFIADVLRRNPGGVTAEEVRGFTRKRGALVASILKDFHGHGWIRTDFRQVENARGRLIRTPVWVWQGGPA